jgi:aconitate hydratase
MKVDEFPGPSRDVILDGEPVRITDLGNLPFERMPYSLRPILESVVRHVGADHPQTHALLKWNQSSAQSVDLFATRVFLHDTNGVPALVDLAAMRHAAASFGRPASLVNPVIPSQLVIDHSVIVDVFGTSDSFEKNVDIEFERNAERYRFLRWGQQSFDDFAVVPPGTGIMHQVNIEYLASVVETRGGWAFPDVCLGTDSHTTMVDALGVLGWGVGGIEAEALMLGEPFSMLVPPVLGFEIIGSLAEGATTTDLVLRITEQLREHGVVGSFVEFYGAGLRSLSVADRATIANMCPEFGATCAYFPIDDATIEYLRFTGRDDHRVEVVEQYAKELGLWYEPTAAIDYSESVQLDLSTVVASIAGPRRPQDRVPLTESKVQFRSDLRKLTNQSPEDDAPTVTIGSNTAALRNGSVAIAAITSCTNTSNPQVMIAAGLLARNAVQRGLTSKPWVKTSLSPGSRVVTDYLDLAGLTPALDELGFTLAGYGCMTCIGASGPLIESVQNSVREHGTSVAAVLSGNRNFDGRINPDVRLNYLASPPLVVAYALAGTVDVDFRADALGQDADGGDVFLGDIWPTNEQITELVRSTIAPEMFTDAYATVFEGDRHWKQIEAPTGATYDWDDESNYLRRPPYLDGMHLDAAAVPDIVGARVLAMLGDQITTDHLSPAGAIPAHTSAGKYLLERGVARFELNTYASRRGNHEVMMRGTLANVRLRNQLLDDAEGGVTLDLVEGSGKRTIYDAAMIARRHSVPLLILGGNLYGAGSSRDWAAKGPALLGVRAVLAESFERIHRANLVGMGILPLEYLPGENAASLGLTGLETFTVRGLSGEISDQVEVQADDRNFRAQVRLDTERERDYYRNGGVMPYVLRKLLS